MPEENQSRNVNFRIRFLGLGVFCAIFLLWLWNSWLFAYVMSTDSWIRDLSNPNGSVRCKAVKALSVRCSLSSLDDLLNVMELDNAMCSGIGPDLPITYFAGEALSCFQGEEAVPVLIQNLKRMTPGKEQLDVIYLLGENGVFAEDALPILRRMVEPASPTSDPAKKYARFAIKQIEDALARRKEFPPPSPPAPPHGAP